MWLVRERPSRRRSTVATPAAALARGFHGLRPISWIVNAESASDLGREDLSRVQSRCRRGTFHVQTTVSRPKLHRHGRRPGCGRARRCPAADRPRRRHGADQPIRRCPRCRGAACRWARPGPRRARPGGGDRRRGRAITDLAVLRAQPELFGPVASDPTAWRALELIDGWPASAAIGLDEVGHSIASGGVLLDVGLA